MVNFVFKDDVKKIAISKEIEEVKEGINMDNLFQSFNELKSYFINASYSLTPYDKRLYGEVSTFRKTVSLISY